MKINVYVGGPSVAQEVQRTFAKTFAGKVKPTVSFVTTRLPHPEAVVAMDAVATTANHRAKQVRRLRSDSLFGTAGVADVAILPAGSRVYVSGQAARTKSLADATRNTMQSLGETLAFLKLNRSHVVQVKAFLRPMSDADVVRREVADVFADQVAPPLVLVEWKSSLPIEIELIAASPPASDRPATEAIEYLTPPGMTASPVYCRVTRVNHPQTIYVSGLYGGPGR